MNWDTFIYFAITSGLCWILGAWYAFRHKRRAALTLSGLGSALFLVFIIGFWVELERPPSPYHGRNPLVVLLLSLSSGYGSLRQVQVSMDARLQCIDVAGFYLHQLAQAGDS